MNSAPNQQLQSHRMLVAEDEALRTLGCRTSYGAVEVLH
jgi:hypothetical protein